MLDCAVLLPHRYPPLGGGRRWWCTLNRHLEAGFQEIFCDVSVRTNLMHVYYDFIMIVHFSDFSI